VGFTRNPATGEHAFFGEYLMNAQGEDVVSGIRTPLSISELERAMPKAYQQLRDIEPRIGSRDRAEKAVLQIRGVHVAARNLARGGEPEPVGFKCAGIIDPNDAAIGVADETSVSLVLVEC